MHVCVFIYIWWIDILCSYIITYSATLAHTNICIHIMTYTCTRVWTYDMICVYEINACKQHHHMIRCILCTTSLGTGQTGGVPWHYMARDGVSGVFPLGASVRLGLKGCRSRLLHNCDGAHTCWCHDFEITLAWCVCMCVCVRMRMSRLSSCRE